MTHDDNSDELETKDFFERGLGLQAVRVAERREKAADYLIDGELPGYVVEVKSRFDSKDVIRAWRDHGQASVVQPAAFYRWAVDVAHNAEKQMLTLDPAGGRWWVLWLGVQNELAAEAVFDQIVGSLYGVREVVYWDQATGGAASRSCLQAYAGAFERSPSIDAAIISHGDGIRFCVNDLRADTKGFTSSILYQSFSRRHPPISVAELLQNYGFLRFDPKAMGERDEGSVKEYIERTYSLQGVHVADMKIATAAIRQDDGAGRS
jgi:hypothetical protein